MRVAKRVLLSAALFCAGGCDKKVEDPAVPAYPSRRPAEELAPSTAAQGGGPPPRNRAPAPLPPAQRDPEALAKVTRGAEAWKVERALADCADVIYEQHTVRIIQPKPGDCTKQFGEKFYTLVGAQVTEVGKGLKPRRPPPPAPLPAKG